MAGSRSSEATVIDRVALLAVVLIYAAGVVVARRALAEAPSATPRPAVAASAQPPGADTPQQGQLARHEVTFELKPAAGLEFKYRLDKGAAMVYSWTASGPVKFELHGEPDGARPGYADTYGTGESQTGLGFFVAPSRGIHGWYWENAGKTPVWMTLKASGFFTAALELRSTGPVEHRLQR
jgi:hypothetical protein